jgi:hypothetical protein
MSREIAASSVRLGVPSGIVTTKASGDPCSMRLLDLTIKTVQ